MQFLSKTEADNLDIAKAILAAFPKTRVFCLYGNLGAGKTTFSKSLCQVLGVTDAVTSPTFSLVNEYEGENIKVYHFDFYRIKSEEEAYDIGYEDYFFSGDYCFVEWGEKIPNLIPDDAVRIFIAVLEEGSRRMEVKI